MRHRTFWASPVGALECGCQITYTKSGLFEAFEITWFVFLFVLFHRRYQYRTPFVGWVTHVNEQMVGTKRVWCNVHQKSFTRSLDYLDIRPCEAPYRMNLTSPFGRNRWIPSIFSGFSQTTYNFWVMKVTGYLFIVDKRFVRGSCLRLSIFSPHPFFIWLLKYLCKVIEESIFKYWMGIM